MSNRTRRCDDRRAMRALKRCFVVVVALMISVVGGADGGSGPPPDPAAASPRLKLRIGDRLIRRDVGRVLVLPGSVLNVAAPSRSRDADRVLVIAPSWVQIVDDSAVATPAACVAWLR